MVTITVSLLWLAALPPRRYEIREPQGDEIKTFVGPRKSKTWIMAIIETSTRLWPVTRVGARNYKNIRHLFGESFHRVFFQGRVLITTDGFKPYSWALKRLFGPTCLCGQVVQEEEEKSDNKG